MLRQFQVTIRYRGEVWCYTFMEEYLKDVIAKISKLTLPELSEVRSASNLPVDIQIRVY